MRVVFTAAACFFFKQKTAYEMRISDWSSDVCSSDLTAETDRVLDLLSGFVPEIRALDDAETLTFLHGCISAKRHPVTVPDTPIYLDGLLVDTPLSGGIEPMLGDQHLRTVTVLGFPNSTRPGILAEIGRAHV